MFTSFGVLNMLSNASDTCARGAKNTLHIVINASCVIVKAREIVQVAVESLSFGWILTATQCV